MPLSYRYRTAHHVPVEDGQAGEPGSTPSIVILKMQHNLE